MKKLISKLYMRSIQSTGIIGGQSMTVAEQIATAAAALDEARRVLEALAASPCGDDDVDDAIAGALEDIESNIAGLHCFAEQCA